MDNINNIRIIPAKFIHFENGETCIINCLIDSEKSFTQQRRFENTMIEDIENPSYMFIGIMQGTGFTQIMFSDAKEYKDMFYEKWGELTI